MTDSGSGPGLDLARAKMAAAGVHPLAIEVFARQYHQLEQGETGMIPEDTIEPLDMPALADVEVDEAAGVRALRETAILKLNGGLGTSMGMDRAKSLLCVRRGLSFLDIIARQVLHQRATYDVPLPVIFMNSFRTSADTLAAVSRYESLPVDGVPLELLQNKEPKLGVRDLQPVSWPADPSLEWCPPGHGDVYTSMSAVGLVRTLLDAGYRQLFLSNADNLGAVAEPTVAGWFAASAAPFAIEAVRRTPSDRKGGHFAIRKSDGRIVLRETAQTLPEDQAALGDLDRHRFSSTNNIWINLEALQAELDAHDGVLELPLIRNVKHVDPADPTSPEVVQVESAMGAAIEVFSGAQTIEVTRHRFVPVKTTNDLLVLRSDVYDIGDDFVLDQAAPMVPFVDLDGVYKLVGEFDKRFKQGAPSLREAESFVVEGDWSFGENVKVVGRVTLDGGRGRVESGTVLTG